MKRFHLLTLILVLVAESTFAGGYVWPGVKYSYAKVYLYNVDGKLMEDHQILKDGKLNSTVQGEGKKLTADQTFQLDRIFGSGPAIDELVKGLSGCYIPRHAIVYYNKKDKPVASMSVSLECEGIRFYSPGYPRNSYASTPKLVGTAEKRLKQIESIIVSTGIKTGFKYTDAIVPDTLINSNSGSMFFTDNRVIDSLFPAKIDYYNFRKMCFTDSTSFSLNQYQSKEKYTAGGSKFRFFTVINEQSEMKFSGPNGSNLSGPNANVTLESAKIYSNAFSVCKKVKIGMSLDEVQSFMTVYDGISNPEIISIQNEDETKKIIFHFFQNRLVYYTVEVRVW